MNKIKRMKAVFEGKKPDKVPAGFWFHYPKDYTNTERIEAHIKLYREVDGDIVKVMDDSFQYLLTSNVRITKPSDWAHITLPGKESQHYKSIADTLKGLLDAVGDEVLVFPTMWSPFKIASFTYGIYNNSSDAVFMEHCKEDPKSVLAGVKAIGDVLADWTSDYLDLGAAGLYYAGQFSEPDRFDADTWASLVKPSDLQVLNVVSSRPDKYNIVHICGESEYSFTSSPSRYADYPGSLFNWDVHSNNLPLTEGRKIFGKPLLGGLNNRGLLASGSPDEIAGETRRVIDSVGAEGLMIGADCTVPADISFDNLRAAVNAAHSYQQ